MSQQHAPAPLVRLGHPCSVGVRTAMGHGIVHASKRGTIRLVQPTDYPRNAAHQLDPSSRQWKRTTLTRALSPILSKRRACNAKRAPAFAGKRNCAARSCRSDRSAGRPGEDLAVHFQGGGRPSRGARPMTHDDPCGPAGTKLGACDGNSAESGCVCRATSTATIINTTHSGSLPCIQMVSRQLYMIT